MGFDSTKIYRRVALLGALTVMAPLTACLTTPVSTMVKLSRITPLDANPADMRFAVRSPSNLRVRGGDISVTLAFDTGDVATSFVEVYRPIVNEDALPGQGIAIGTQDGSHLAIARFSDADARSMKAAQTRVKSLRAAGVEGQGSFSVDATGCRQGQLPGGPVFLTTWLKTAPAEDYFVLTRNIDLRKVLKKAGKDISDIRVCNA